MQLRFMLISVLELPVLHRSRALVSDKNIAVEVAGQCWM